MKFGKSLFQVIELSDPEWGPYWINYKYLKKKINEIILEQQEANTQQQQQEAKNKQLEDMSSSSDDGKKILQQRLAKSTAEVEFFKLLRKELKKTSDFFSTSEMLCKVRKERLWNGLEMLKNQSSFDDINAWTRLMASCVRFYKDVLLLENYAIMNYCGFSKILKKHDKRTGYALCLLPPSLDLSPHSLFRLISDTLRVMLS
jgi:SPX domain protein involved in polyphosphate accumulation